MTNTFLEKMNDKEFVGKVWFGKSMKYEEELASLDPMDIKLVRIPLFKKGY